jgi:hypothetical protein
MRARGLSQIEITHVLQVSKESISSDMQYLRNQATESIREYVTEHLPEQYQIYLTTLDTIIKRGFEVKDLHLPNTTHFFSKPLEQRFISKYCDEKNS